MTARLKPYPAYVDTGLPWIERVPEHWTIERAKWLFRKMDRPVDERDEVVTCFRDGQVTLRRKRRIGGFTEALQEIGYQGIRGGDLVIHAMDAFAGAIGVSDSDGKGTPVYSVCEPRRGANTYYYAYLVREMARTQWILALAKGIRERSTDFRFEAFSAQRLPVPPPREQDAVVRYLNNIDRRVRRFIRDKQKLIKLLEEQKQAMSHRAVTRGLDPCVRSKPSGVSWFPEVPEHWTVLPMRRVIRRAVDGPHFSPEYIDSGIPFLSARNIRTDEWKLDDAKFISEADYAEFCKRVTPEVGDVLYTKGGTTGVARAVDLPFPFQVWVHVAVLKLHKSNITPEYLALALNSPGCYEQAQLYTRGATNQDLGLGRMKDIVLPVPPLSEQKAIVRSVEASTRGLLGAIADTRHEMSLLREYRTRLVTDVVTGRLDVSEATANLPDEVDASEPLDGEDLLIEAGEATSLEPALKEVEV